MTEIEQAIREITSYMHSDAYCDAPSNAACATAIAALREKLARKQTAPLTLEELRGIRFEPLFIDRFNGGPSFWYIAADVGTGLDLYRGGCHYEGFMAYGKTWLAYRRPPEQ